MKPLPARLLLVATGLIVAWSAVTLELSVGIGADMLAPFGVQAILVVQLVAVIPLAWGIALVFRRGAPALIAPGRVVVWGFVALVVVGGTLTSGEQAAQDLATEEAGFATCLLVRACWCFALVLPWCCLAESWWPTRRHTGGGLVALFALGLLTAVAIPAVHTRARIEHEIALTVRALDGGSLGTQLAAVRRLMALGAVEPISLAPVADDSRRPADLMARLMEIFDGYRYEAATPLPSNPTVSMRIRRARILLDLDQPADARQIVREIADDDAVAAGIVAASWQDEQHWSESDHWFRRTMALADAPTIDRRQAVRIRVAAFDGLIKNAQGRADRTAVESLLREAAGEFRERHAAPEIEARFEFRLGQALAPGHPSAAESHFERASELAPGRYTLSVEQAVAKVRHDSPRCLFRAP